MKRTTGLIGVSLCALAAGLATGCESGTAYQIDAQQERIAALEKEKGQLEADLRAMRMAADAARNRAMELDRELAEARRLLAEKPEMEVASLPPNWEGNSAIAWTNIAEDILFDSGKANLKATGKQKIGEVTAQIRDRFPNHSIWIVGHTDNDPIMRTKHLYEDNLELSLKRGHTVFHELRNQGIDPTDMVAGGQGEYNPIASNESKEGKAKNRRVQIIAIARPETPRG